MALILKQEKAVSDPTDGDITTAYVNTKFTGGWNKRQNNSVRVDFNMFRRVEDKLKNPIAQQIVYISATDFNNIIDAPITSDELTFTDSEGVERNRKITEIFAHRIYLYILTMTEINDEGVEETIYFFGIPVTDWMSDE